MKKIELEIVALSNTAAQSQSYAVVLGEKPGIRRLPIVIGAAEAQSIAIAIEGIKPTRPLTHDLFKNVLNQLQINLKEIVINNLQDGIFYSRLLIEHDGEITEIDSRTSDALALAVRFACPIYTYEFILEQAGVILEDSDSSKTREVNEDEPEDISSPVKDISRMTMDELKAKLNELLEKEEYEKAIQYRDEIEKRKKESS